MAHVHLKVGAVDPLFLLVSEQVLAGNAARARQRVSADVIMG